ncbi:helix-turn-helix transcriptional regulator [Clostridium sp. 001]|uniref:helix-turn-helix domain-containing protein n=1 Tax=Clostridium sp. 001 TaxID=1970093 RepID=UPI001C2C5EB0|nr:hypothetical protein B5S50_17390 [Clostridium sp. 001]
MQIKIKPYRIAFNLTLSQMSKKTNISRTHLSNIERNLELPSPLVFNRLYNIFEICPYDLIDFCNDCTLKKCPKNEV